MVMIAPTTIKIIPKVFIIKGLASVSCNSIAKFLKHTSLAVSQATFQSCWVEASTKNLQDYPFLCHSSDLKVKFGRITAGMFLAQRYCTDK